MQQKTNPQQFKRWADTIVGYVGGVELEVYFRDFNQQPSLEEFMHMRRETSGVRVVLAMVEATKGIARARVRLGWQPHTYNY